MERTGSRIQHVDGAVEEVPCFVGIGVVGFQRNDGRAQDGRRAHERLTKRVNVDTRQDGACRVKLLRGLPVLLLLRGEMPPTTAEHLARRS